jgi:hypothetical protein
MATTPKLPLVKFSKATRNAVCKTSDGLPDLGTWLTRVAALGHPLLTDAVEGVWCGREGRVTLDLPGANAMLCMGWHAGRVEWAYLS